MKKNILLIGGGGHCRSVIDVLELSEKYKIIGIIDKKELIGQKVLKYSIIDCDENLFKYKKINNIIITIGQIKSAENRIRLFNICKELNYIFPVVISPLAYVSKYVFIDEGTVVMHHALVNANARIGKNCIINTKALVEHDAVVEDYCHISTGAIVNGGTVIKQNTFFGSNATARDNITTGGFIKAGSLVK